MRIRTQNNIYIFSRNKLENAHLFINTKSVTNIQKAYYPKAKYSYF